MSSKWNVVQAEYRPCQNCCPANGLSPNGIPTNMKLNEAQNARAEAVNSLVFSFFPLELRLSVLRTQSVICGTTETVA